MKQLKTWCFAISNPPFFGLFAVSFIRCVWFRIFYPDADPPFRLATASLLRGPSRFGLDDNQRDEHPYHADGKEKSEQDARLYATEDPLRRNLARNLRLLLVGRRAEGHCDSIIDIEKLNLSVRRPISKSKFLLRLHLLTYIRRSPSSSCQGVLLLELYFYTGSSRPLELGGTRTFKATYRARGPVYPS